MQRTIDFIFSFSALVLASPILVAIIIILKFTGEGEIFYKQNRVGAHGQLFSLLKFATMLKNSESIGTGTVTIKNDPRVLPFGKFLRKTKLNELPQLINVLLGEMSLIGPRPQELRCFSAYPIKSQEVIKSVRPGLSGMGSIFFRNEEDFMDGSDNPDYIYDNLIMPYKGELEEWFVLNQSMYLYFKLIFLTILIIFIPDRINAFLFFKDIPRPPESIASKFLS